MLVELLLERGAAQGTALWGLDQDLWHETVHRLLFSGATDTAPDRLGRILLPSFLRDYAELRDSVVLVGLLKRAEIWSHDNWLTERSQAEEQSTQLADHLFNLGV